MCNDRNKIATQSDQPAKDKFANDNCRKIFHATRRNRHENYLNANYTPAVRLHANGVGLYMKMIYTYVKSTLAIGLKANILPAKTFCRRLTINMGTNCLNVNALPENVSKTNGCMRMANMRVVDARNSYMRRRRNTKKALSASRTSIHVRSHILRRRIRRVPEIRFALPLNIILCLQN